MLKNKLSHIAILEEQVEKLQDLANQFSVITGHGIEEIEDGIVRLLTKRAPDAANVCRVINHFYVDGVCSQCGSKEPPRG